MKPWALITGSTGGIGKALCQEFIKDEYNLILVGRNIDKLLELKRSIKQNQIIELIEVDLRKKDAYLEIYTYVQNKKIEVDVLVNAAGFGIYGDLVEQAIELNQDLVTVNITNLISLCNIFGKEMRKRRSGYIINFSSISAFFPGKLMATYYASKAFVLSFSIALAEELKKDNVKVLALCPGVIDTPFYKKSKSDRSHSFLLDRMPPISPLIFAKKAYKIIKKQKEYYKIVGLKNKILIFLSLFLPRRILGKIIGFVQAKKPSLF